MNEKENTTLVSWDMIEEKTEYYKDKIILLMLVGITASIFAFIFESYVFSLFCIIAPITLIYIGKRDPLKLHFRITDEGLYLENDFIPVEKIEEYNIIDDPGERARLILRINNFISVNQVIPIYDVQMNQIHQSMERLEIEIDEEIGMGFIEKLNTII